MYRTTIALFIAVAVLSGGYSLAGTYQIAPTEDTWVYQPTADTNYGSSTDLGIAIQFMSQRGYTFLKFTMPTLSGNEVITSATLYLYQFNGAGYGEGPTALDLLSNNTWSETTATWNNHPDATYTRLATSTDGHSHIGWSSWSFPWSASYGETISLRLAENSSGDQSHNWYSKEYAGSYKPYLEITTGPRSPSDFNTDGKPDLVWHHQTTGLIGVWLMNGTAMTSSTLLTPSTVADTNWTSVCVADFNADGKPDLVWQHQTSGWLGVWLMNGTAMTSSTLLTPSSVTDINWKIVGCTDVNADGKPDILWQHQTTGLIGAWLMNGTSMTSSTLLTPSTVADTHWKIVGVADVNADGKPDILWQHQTTGLIGAWLMNGTAMTSSTLLTPSSVTDTNWKIVGVADVNADGKPDILWQHQTTGWLGAWLMNGTTMTSSTLLTPSSVTDTHWKIVGPK